VDVLKVLEQSPNRPLKLEHKSLKLASRLLDMCYLANHQKEDGLRVAEYLLHSGKAEAKFREIIKAQRGDPDISWQKIKLAKHSRKYLAPHSGKIVAVNNYQLSALAKILGAPQDCLAGLALYKKLDEKISKNDILMELFSQSESKLEEAWGTLANLSVYRIE